MTGIKIYRGEFWVGRRADKSIYLSARPGFTMFEFVVNTEEEARRWLCDKGLRKPKAIKLLAAELRGEGDYANPSHPNRLK